MGCMNSPTFGMYKVSAQILGVGIIEVHEIGFKLNTKAIIGLAKENTINLFQPQIIQQQTILIQLK